MGRDSQADMLLELAATRDSQFFDLGADESQSTASSADTLGDTQTPRQKAAAGHASSQAGIKYSKAEAGEGARDGLAARVDIADIPIWQSCSQDELHGLPTPEIGCKRPPPEMERQSPAPQPKLRRMGQSQVLDDVRDSDGVDLSIVTAPHRASYADASGIAHSSDIASTGKDLHRPANICNLGVESHSSRVPELPDASAAVTTSVSPCRVDDEAIVADRLPPATQYPPDRFVTEPIPPPAPVTTAEVSSRSSPVENASTTVASQQQHQSTMYRCLHVVFYVHKQQIPFSVYDLRIDQAMHLDKFVGWRMQRAVLLEQSALLREARSIGVDLSYASLVAVPLTHMVARRAPACGAIRLRPTHI